MSRSGYADEYSNWDLIIWRGAVASAIRGKRGQQFLVDLAAALDAMPDKRLIAGALEYDGEYCALGALGEARGLPVDKLDPEDSRQVAVAFDIADALAREVMYRNDEAGEYNETPEARWTRMRAWVESSLAQGGES